jgi:hypothetical protein
MTGPRVRANQLHRHVDDVERLLLRAVVLLLVLAVTLAMAAG